MKRLSKLNLKNTNLMTNSEMKMIVGGEYGHDLQACKCPNGKVYYVSASWNCADAAKEACKL